MTDMPGCQARYIPFEGQLPTQHYCKGLHALHLPSILSLSGPFLELPDFVLLMSVILGSGFSVGIPVA